MHRPTCKTCTHAKVAADANPAGNVHGGTLLRLVDEAGLIVATRHANRNRTADQPTLGAALARIETMSFLAPVFIGQVAHANSRVTFTSPSSIGALAARAACHPTNER